MLPAILTSAWPDRVRRAHGERTIAAMNANPDGEH